MNKPRKPHPDYKHFNLQCWSPMKGARGEYVDHLKPHGTFEELVATAQKMRECPSRIGISKDGKTYAYPKGLQFDPRQ